MYVAAHIFFLSLFDFVLFLPFPFQKVYKASYEKSRGFSINYCDTPKFQMDSVLKQFSDVRELVELKFLWIWATYVSLLTHVLIFF